MDVPNIIFAFGSTASDICSAMVCTSRIETSERFRDATEKRARCAPLTETSKSGEEMTRVTAISALLAPRPDPRPSSAAAGSFKYCANISEINVDISGFHNQLGDTVYCL